GIVTAAWMPSIMDGSLMRATPPSRRISAGTRSSAITADAPASSAIFACVASTTSMMTPPRNISASPRFTRAVPVVRSSVMAPWYRRGPAALPRYADRVADLRQLDPGLAGRQWDLLAGGIEEARRLLLRSPLPRARDDLAHREDPHVAVSDHHCFRAFGTGARVVLAAHVVDELH